MASYNVGNIEIGVVSNTKKATTNLDSVISKMQELNKLDKNIKSFDNLSSTVKQVSKLPKLDFSKLVNVGKLYLLYNYSKRIVSNVAKFVGYATDYVEILNKFQVSFGDLYDENLKSVNQLAQAFGFSTNTLLDYTATFNNMLNALDGLTRETSATISQTLTRMAIDFSSLFNVSIDSAMTAFQSALSGNIRTIRSISGFDVSETTIFSIYQQMGGTKTMRQLTQIEKRLLRIIAIQRQLEETGALGDYGRTIETVSNQVKILQEQVIELGKWVGMNLLVYIKPVIQYANAFILTLKEMAKTMASTLEDIYDIDYETEFAGFGALTDDTNQLTTAVDELSNSLEQLPFDRLNILGETSTATSNLEIDEKILGELKKYTMYLDKINYKAKEISESILLWLGYSKVLNEKTGEYEWVIDYADSNLKSILDTIKAIGTLILGASLYKKIASIVTAIGSIKIGSTTISAIFGQILSKVGMTVAQFGALVTTIVVAIASFIDLYIKVDDFRDKANETFSSIFGHIKNLGIDLKYITDGFKVIGVTVESILGNSLLQIFNLIEAVLGAFEKLIKLDFTGVVNEFSDFTGGFINTFEDMFKDAMTLLLGQYDTLLWNRVFDEIFGTLKHSFNSSMNEVKGGLSTVSDFLIYDIWENIQKFFKSVPNWIDTNVWKPIGNFFVSMINGIIGAFESMINLFVKGINSLIGGAKDILSFAGITVGAVNEVSFGRIPALAKGGIIDRPTTALVGEYSGAKSNPEIVTPENLMREVFIESMLPIAQAIMSGNKEMVSAIEDMANRPIELNGRKVSENLYSHLENVAIRKGKTLFGT